MKITRITPSQKITNKDGHASTDLTRPLGKISDVLERIVGDPVETFDPDTITLPDLARVVRQLRNRIAEAGS